MIKIVVNKELSGACPTLLDIEDSLVNISKEESIELRWGNSRQEQVALLRQQERKFVLYVPDIPSAERATATLGSASTLGSNLVSSARTSLLNSKLYNWRDFAKEQGAAVTRNIVLKLAADEIRQGKSPKLARVATDLFLSGINPINADTLHRLCVFRSRK